MSSRPQPGTAETRQRPLGDTQYSSTGRDMGASVFVKSSMKYSKPAILQGGSPAGANLGGSFVRANQSTGHALNRSVRIHHDHDDLQLKLEKLTEKFLAAHKEKDAFKDTFYDEEIFREIKDGKNYFKLSLDLMKYVLHSGNQPKRKKEETKKTGVNIFELKK